MKYERQWARLPAEVVKHTGKPMGEVARRLSTTVQYLDKITDGRAVPGRVMQERMADRFGLSLAQLVSLVEVKRS